MISLRNAEQIIKMRTAGHLLEEIMKQVCAAVQPGVTTKYLDNIAEKLIRGAGGVPSFYGYHGFPASLCTSVDDVVVHGIPDDVPLREGSILGIDCGLVLDGWHSDMARTVAVGSITSAATHLMAVTEQCFWKALAVSVEGNRLGDIGYAVQSCAESAGYSVVLALCGHGIGRDMHEEPEVANVGIPGRGLRLRRGMTIAIEPMINAGHFDVLQTGDWDVRTADGKLSAHYENTILITSDEPEVLTMKTVEA